MGEIDPVSRLICFIFFSCYRRFHYEKWWLGFLAKAGIRVMPLRGFGTWDRSSWLGSCGPIALPNLVRGIQPHWIESQVMIRLSCTIQLLPAMPCWK